MVYLSNICLDIPIVVFLQLLKTKSSHHLSMDENDHLLKSWRSNYQCIEDKAFEGGMTCSMTCISSLRLYIYSIVIQCCKEDENNSYVCVCVCWLWRLIIFMFHRSLFLVVFIPHEDCTPLHAGWGGVCILCGVWGKAGPWWGFGE